MQKQDEWNVPSSVLLIQSLKSLVVLEWLITSRRHGKPLDKPRKAKGSLPQEVQRSKLAQLSPMFPCNTGTTSRHLTYTFRMLQPGKKILPSSTVWRLPFVFRGSSCFSKCHMRWHQPMLHCSHLLWCLPIVWLVGLWTLISFWLGLCNCLGCVGLLFHTHN